MATALRRRSKMGNVRTAGPDPRGGTRTYDSALEARYAADFKAMRDAGHLLGFEVQVPYRFIVNGCPVKTRTGRTVTYRADFLLTYPNGRQEVVEVKGRWTATAELKWAIFRALYPHLPARVVP